MALDVAKIRAALAKGGGGSADNRFAGYLEDPIGLTRDVLRLDLWSHQRRAVEALVTKRRVTWRTGHGIGKSLTAVAAAAWFILTRPNSIVILTAPSYRQVSLVLWRGLKEVVARAKVPLGGELLDQPEVGWRFSNDRLVVGLSAGDAERFAGLHARNVLIICDEASGIEQPIFEAVKGSLTGESRLLLIGNPTQTSGEFFDSFHRKADLYHCLHTSALDSPNITGAEPAIPGLVDRVWLDELAADFGEESAAYHIRGLGEFAQQSADCVIGLGLVEAAQRAWLEIMADGGRAFSALGRLEIGVDPARFGDDFTAIVCRRGNVALAPVTFRGADVVQVAERVRQVANEHRTRGERPVVRVDSVGVGGGVADVLRRSGDLTVQDVNAGAAARSPNYQRCRDELWFSLRDWLRGGGALPPDEKLAAELVTPTYSYSPAQKVTVESKDETKKKLRRSPDRADALALSIYAAPTAVTPSMGTVPVCP